MKKLSSFLLICCTAIVFILASALAEAAGPRLTLNETAVRVAVGKSVQLKTAIENAPSGKKGKATWETSDPDVCTVSASGTVKAVSEGKAIVTCTMAYPEGETCSAQCEVTAFTAAKSLKAVTGNIRVNVGETAAAEYTLLPENTTEKIFDWSSADEGVAAVDAEGRITGIAPGTTKVTAVTKDGTNLKAVFNVYVPTLWVPEGEYTITDVQGVSVPLSYFGPDFENDLAVKVTGKPLRCSIAYDDHKGRNGLLLLEAKEAGDSKVEITDKKDKKAKYTLTVHSQEEAITHNSLLEITSLSFKTQSDGTIIFRFTAKNHSSRYIERIYCAMDFLNAEGEQRYHTAAEDGYVPHLDSNYWALPCKLEPGAEKTFQFRHSCYMGDDIAEIRMAVTYIQFAIQYVRIPDNQKYWFSSVSGYMQKPEIKPNRPLQDVPEDYGSTYLGFDRAEIGDFLQDWYGSASPGFYVTHIDQNSIAMKCGLWLRDVIIEIDGVRFTDDFGIIEEGKTKVENGQRVSFKVLRNNKIVDLTFHQ